MGGSLIGAAMQAFILPRWGWTGAMYLGGALSLVVMPIVWPWLPESPRFLVRRNSTDPRLARFITKVDPTIEPGTPMHVADCASARGGGAIA